MKARRIIHEADVVVYDRLVAVKFWTWPAKKPSSLAWARKALVRR